MKKKTTRRHSRIRVVQTEENKLRVAMNALPKTLEAIADRASRDNGAAGLYQGVLLRVLSDAVERMNELVKQHPDRWRWLSEQTFAWPVLLPNKRTAAALHLLKKIGLGKRVPVRIKANTNLDNPAVRKAIELWNQIVDARPWPVKVSYPEWQRKAHELGEPVKANAPQYWTVAKMKLDAEHPSPTLGNDPNLRRLAVSRYKEGDVHQQIRTKIKRAFLKLFPPAF